MITPVSEEDLKWLAALFYSTASEYTANNIIDELRALRAVADAAERVRQAHVQRTCPPESEAYAALCAALRDAGRLP